jgi:hypothetical protein
MANYKTRWEAERPPTAVQSRASRQVPGVAASSERSASGCFESYDEVMKAMLQMKKIDIEKLRRAYDG